tara:strand:+ start:2592 stop:2918 length:327 start_codon:yes stop_codon:yes gene_type:complete
MFKNRTTLPKDIVEYIISFDPTGLVEREKILNKKKIKIYSDIIMFKRWWAYPLPRRVAWTQPFNCGNFVQRFDEKPEKPEETGFNITNNNNGYWTIIHQGKRTLMKSN